MRIAVFNWSNRRAGGIESYLTVLTRELVRAGHEVEYYFELDEPEGREHIKLPATVSSYCLESHEHEEAVAHLRAWQPQLLFTHKLNNLEFEAAALKIAPAVFFAHDYQRTCISGAKAYAFPTISACDRRFGPLCLMHYFPHRCGGLSPMTMIHLYRSQMARLQLLRQYSAVVTHSEHMLKELLKHGVAPERAHRLPFLVETRSASETLDQTDRSDRGCSTDLSACSEKQGNGVRLIFSGRMEQVKGGQVLLDSLVEVQRLLGRDVSLVLVGDGPKRREWQRRAEQLRRHHPWLTIEFVGWLEQANLDTWVAKADLMVVPSLWPEPFGLAGPEAALQGVPAVAFDVGGVSEWLVDGVNGYLATADPPSAAGLAQAIARCFRDGQTYSQLRQGALKLAGRYSIEAHLTSLMKVFNAVVSVNRASAS